MRRSRPHRVHEGKSITNHVEYMSQQAAEESGINLYANCFGELPIFTGGDFCWTRPENYVWNGSVKFHAYQAAI